MGFLREFGDVLVFFGAFGWDFVVLVEVWSILRHFGTLKMMAKRGGTQNVILSPFVKEICEDLRDTFTFFQMVKCGHFYRGVLVWNFFRCFWTCFV